MKAKLVNEALKDVLKPKTEEDIEKAFDEHPMGPRIKRAMKYLEEQGAHVESFQNSEFVIQMTDVYAGNWQIGQTFNAEQAEKLITAHKLYDKKRGWQEYSYKPVHGTSYFSLDDIEQMMYLENKEKWEMKDIDLGSKMSSRIKW
jgi:hypothetical protein